ncbi:MAG TPA: fused MFS/spermidine synthase [Solirubrobacteraceae bacterium]
MSGAAARRRFVAVEARTTFHVARVEPDRRRPGGRLLLLDERETSHVDLGDPTWLEFGYMRRIADVIDELRPREVVHLGGGACTLARYLHATRPGSVSEVYERDEGVLRVAREHLGLRTHPRLRVRIGDAARLLPRRADASADMVIGDAFVGLDVPEPLTTPEFTAHVRRVLRPAGVYALNVDDAAPLAVARRHAATLLGAFAHVAVVAPRPLLRGRGGGNVVLLASETRLPIAPLRRRAAGSVDREEVLAGAAARDFAAAA